MLIKHSTLVMLSLFLLLSFVACQTGKAPPQTSESESHSMYDIEGVAPPNNGTAVFEFEVLPSYDASKEMQDYIHFIDQNCLERTWDIIIAVSQNISSFCFIELDESEDLKIGRTLYTHYAWKHEKPLMLHTYINDTTLNRGISYVNGNGEVIYMGFFSDMSGINSENIYLDEISIGLIPNGTYEPQVTDTSNHVKDHKIFDNYFNNYVRNENKATWSYIGISVGKYYDPTNNGYTQFDIYRIEHTDGNWIEYYAVPFNEKQIETVYKFQFDDSMVPVWIKSAS